MQREMLWRFGVVTIFAGAFVWDYGHTGLAMFLVLIGLLEIAYPHIVRAQESTDDE